MGLERLNDTAHIDEGLNALRELILQTAAEIPEVGPLTETVKWGQPSFAAQKGTPIRIGRPKSGGFGLFVHCQTRVIPDFQAEFGGAFTFDGTRGVLFERATEIDTNKLRILIQRALTYHT